MWFEVGRKASRHSKAWGDREKKGGFTVDLPKVRSVGYRPRNLKRRLSVGKTCMVCVIID